MTSGTKCQCVTCPECKGHGMVYFAITGAYLGSNRCDDCDSLETCETCRGVGTSEACLNCAEALADEEDCRNGDW